MVPLNSTVASAAHPDRVAGNNGEEGPSVAVARRACPCAPPPQPCPSSVLLRSGACRLSLVYDPLNLRALVGVVVWCGTGRGWDGGGEGGKGREGREGVTPPPLTQKKEKKKKKEKKNMDSEREGREGGGGVYYPSLFEF